MADDPSTGQLVLFGGSDESYASSFNDTWRWNGTTWTELSPATSPPDRSDASLAYDPATHQLVLFGGTADGGLTLNDTWTWNGTTWKARSPATSPPVRADATMAYDRATQQLVLFGGDRVYGPNFIIMNDTWTWNGKTWTQLSPATSPPARYGASMAYDSASKQLVLFGGATDYGSDLGDTWIWDGLTWTQSSPAVSPSARFFSSMAYDASAGQLVLFGGATSDSAFFDDTWTWKGTTWKQLKPASSPTPRYIPAMAYNHDTGQLILFGGRNGATYLNDTWDYMRG